MCHFTTAAELEKSNNGQTEYELEARRELKGLVAQREVKQSLKLNNNNREEMEVKGTVIFLDSLKLV